MLAIASIFVVVSVDQLVGIWYPFPDATDGFIEPHPVRGWVNMPNASYHSPNMSVDFNAIGLRERDLPIRKPQGERRFLFVGDSTTFGYGLNVEETFERRLDSLLPPNVCAINAGVSGYTTWQETDYLRSEGLSLSPDLVVLGFCVNDIDDAPRGKCRGHPIVTFPPLNHMSGLVRMFSKFKRDRFRGEGLWIPRDEFDVCSTPPSPRWAPAIRRTFDDLNEFDNVCKSAGVPWRMILFPAENQIPATPGWRRLRAALKEWAATHRVPFLDLSVRFEAWAMAHGGSPKPLFFDNLHPGPLGARLIAVEIAKALDLK